MNQDQREFLEQLDETHDIDVRNGEALVWVFGHHMTLEEKEHYTDQLRELLPEQEHIVLDDLEDVYQIDTGE